jgi:hypothetical protein
MRQNGSMMVSTRPWPQSPRKRPYGLPRPIRAVGSMTAVGMNGRRRNLAAGRKSPKPARKPGTGLARRRVAAEIQENPAPPALRQPASLAPGPVYFGLATKVTSLGPASSMPRTPVTSMLAVPAQLRAQPLRQLFQLHGCDCNGVRGPGPESRRPLGLLKLSPQELKDHMADQSGDDRDEKIGRRKNIGRTPGSFPVR